MCTVTFIARKNGYALGMNRDEKLSRSKALPPKINREGSRLTVGPAEQGGGTWISLNDAGATFALINWYSVARRVERDPVSRGEVVKALRGETSPDVVREILHGLRLSQTNPFRLITVFPASFEVCEWRWDLRQLTRHNRPWWTQQWISSGFDEPMAQRVRSRTFRQRMAQKSAGSLDWLRRLHRSHAPVCGPFSTCMHREDAATVSYTEVVVTAGSGRITYADGPPCEYLGRLRARILY